MRKLLAAFLLALSLSSAAAQCPAVPALPDTERLTQYAATSQTGPFNVGFAVYGDGTDYGNWISVYVNGVLQSPSSYTLTSPSGSLSTICRPITNARITFAAAQTGTVQIVGARRARRASQFAENRGVAARDFNQVITDLTAENRETWDRFQRVLQGLPGEIINPLPAAAARANSYLYFDASGNPITVLATPPTPPTPATATQCVTYTPVVGDNTAAFNTAAANAVTLGLTLCVPGGTPSSPVVIGIDSSMTIPSGLRLKCAGRDLTIFRKSANSAGVTFVAMSNVDNVYISDCTFDLNGHNNLSTAQYYGMAGTHVSNFTMERVALKNPFKGALIEIIGDGTTPTVPNTNQLNSNITIRDSLFEALNTGVNPSGGDLFDLTQIDGLLFENNVIVGGASNGSCAANGATFGYNRRFVIQNNRVLNCYRSYYMETSQDGAVLNNDASNNANILSAFANMEMIGFWLVDANQTYTGGGYSGVERVLVQGNKVHDQTRATGTTGVTGIKLSAPAGVLAAKDVVIEGNSCFNNSVSDSTGTTTCISLEGANDTIIVRNNTARSLTTPSVGVTTTKSYTSSGMPAAQSTLNMLVADNKCISVDVCQTVPSVSVCAMNTSATCALKTYSTDAKGVITVTAGTTGTATATLELTFSASMVSNVGASVCSWTALNGTGSFTAPVTILQSAGGTTTNRVAVTNGANFTPGSTYAFEYKCAGF